MNDKQLNDSKSLTNNSNLSDTNSLKLSDFDYDLPPDFIAQTPLVKRAESKLLIHNRQTEKTEIKHFYNILDYLKKGDVLVINNTRVIPARLFGTKASTGAKIEIFLLKKIKLDTYTTLVKPLKRLKTDETVILSPNLQAKLLEKDEVAGTATMRFICENPHEIESLLEQLGTMPLPHYITKKLDKNNEERYQTVYNKTKGSVAAPTAGLHWTPELIAAAKTKGVIFAEILLHVGLGTFRPVKTENLTDHKMHSEYYEISAESAEIINRAKAENRRVICVGTTSLRTLEGSVKASEHKSIVDKYNSKTQSLISAGTGETDIFIYPPYKFRIADAIITNFHLPKSTLLMLVAAFAGREKVLELYELAKQNNFRFFSFGDCMFIM